jgi:hypothetical protein
LTFGRGARHGAQHRSRNARPTMTVPVLLLGKTIRLLPTTNGMLTVSVFE